MKEIHFWKMHGAGNDFILMDDRDETFQTDDNEWIASISARKTGIGCEGVILIQPSSKADFRMRFFNPDGNEVEMCGNGARCVAQLANEIEAARKEMTIETVAGILQAEILDQGVRVEMTEPTGWKMNNSLEVDEEEVNYHFVNTGVPHVVVETNNVNTCNVSKLGSGIRYHEAFRPAGTNVNFISVTDPHSLRIRTYERGVEAETLACGTGIVASALIAARVGHVKPPVEVTAAGGDVLTVNFELTAETALNVTLLGPTAHVFQGTLAHEESGQN
ncbi:diaminopimelate epimerase [Verrucomicrobiota bacterium]